MVQNKESLSSVVEFKKGIPSDIADWEISFCEDDEFGFFTLNGVVIGAGNIYIYSNNVYIANIESKEERKGHGRMMINYLKSLDGIDYILGESVEEALYFWHRMGAKFNEEDFNKVGEGDDDLLIRFRINC